MKFFDLFKGMPPIPTAPVALQDGKLVDQDAFIESLDPLDVGLTRGSGMLGWWENLFRMKENEGPNLMTHAFLQYSTGKIVESNWPCVKIGKPTAAYLGGKRHTVFFRYARLETWQRMGAISAAQTVADAKTPYASGQIFGFLPEFLGGKPAGNKDGVTCSEFATVILRGQQIPFVPGTDAWNITPTDALTWLGRLEAKSAGWIPVAECIGDRYWITI